MNAGGAEMAVCLGRHVVALTGFRMAANSPTALLLEAGAWLKGNNMSPARLPRGIRLLGRGAKRDWPGSMVEKCGYPLSVPDDNVLSRALARELVESHKELVDQLYAKAGFHREAGT